MAITASLPSLDLARDMTECRGDREEGIARWIRAAAADGCLDAPDPAFAAAQLECLVKGFAFWPQLAMGQPPLGEARQKVVAEGAVEMFLARYGSRI